MIVEWTRPHTIYELKLNQIHCLSCKCITDHSKMIDKPSYLCKRCDSEITFRDALKDSKEI